MPLNIAEHPGPLTVDQPEQAEVFSDLQGNILNSHGREAASHLFLRFSQERIGDVGAALADLADGFLTSARAQAEASARFKETHVDGGLFAHLALSAAGYRVLGIPDEKIPHGANLRNRKAAAGYCNVFGLGMKSRAEHLQDPPLDRWQPSLQGEIHALIILAADRAETLERGREELARRFGWNDSLPLATLVASEPGLVLRRHFRSPVGDTGVGQPIEHFGFVDGISQPLLLTKSSTPAALPTKWDTTAPPRLVLVPDPQAGASQKSFGSFLVFRKLEQNVKGFRESVKALADELNCSPGLVGAMAVGRFADGTPVVLQGVDGGPEEALNDFNYDDDPNGRRCPFHAHIRKTNPRLESAALKALSEDTEEERGHRIARRAMPYGAEGYSDSDPPEQDVGLLFMCYQSDIWEQFEFQQAAWSNNGRFLHPGTNSDWEVPPAYALGTGIDAVIGQQAPAREDLVAGPDTPRNWPAAWDRRPSRTQRTIAKFVTLKGGEYFFSPSLTGIKSLATPVR